jgi:hypothetical protein
MDGTGGTLIKNVRENIYFQNFSMFGEVIMVRVTPRDESIRREIEGSINAFLRGKGNQKWVIGKIRAIEISKEALRQLFSDFYLKNPKNLKLLELEKECQKLGFL